MYKFTFCASIARNDKMDLQWDSEIWGCHSYTEKLMSDGLFAREFYLGSKRKAIYKILCRLGIKFWFSSLYIADFKTYNFVLRRVFSFSTRKLEPQVRIQLCRYMYVRVSSVLLVSFQMGQLRPITSVQRILKPWKRVSGPCSPAAPYR